jgi:hypothetical protein
LPWTTIQVSGTQPYTGGAGWSIVWGGGTAIGTGVEYDAAGYAIAGGGTAMGTGVGYDTAGAAIGGGGTQAAGAGMQGTYSTGGGMSGADRYVGCRWNRVTPGAMRGPLDIGAGMHGGTGQGTVLSAGTGMIR